MTKKNTAPAATAAPAPEAPTAAKRVRAPKAAKLVAATEVAPAAPQVAPATAPEAPTAPAPTLTREQWLEAAVWAMQDAVLKPAGYAMPDRWKIAPGFAKGSAKAIGQCWPPVRSSDGTTTHLFVCPSLGEDVVRVLDVVLHEMGHAAVGCEHGHKAPFRAFVKAVGLDGKVTATRATEGTPLHEKLSEVARNLGDYPHPALKPETKRKAAQGGWIRMMSTNDDSYRVLVSPKMMDEHGAPRDPWGDEMTPVNGGEG